jgi:hypothetical protein
MASRYSLYRISRLPSGSKNEERRAQPANSRQTILQNHLADSTIDNTQNIFTLDLNPADTYELEVTRNDADGDWITPWPGI